MWISDTHLVQYMMVLSDNTAALNATYLMM